MGGRRKEEEIGTDRKTEKVDPEIGSDGRKGIRLRVRHQLGLDGFEFRLGIPARPTEESGKPGSVEIKGARRARSRSRARAWKAETSSSSQRPLREVLRQVGGRVRQTSSKQFLLLHFAALFEAILNNEAKQKNIFTNETICFDNFNEKKSRIFLPQEEKEDAEDLSIEDLSFD